MPAGYSAVLALLIAGPLLGPGYLLLRDAVSTPRSYLTDSALGLGDAAPRAVPQDAMLAVLSPIIDGGLLVKAILVIALWAAGYGAAVLARELLRAGLGPQLVATTVALWNPYIAERLLQGHWSLLAGYAALPWTALAAYRLRSARAPRTDAGISWRARNSLGTQIPTGAQGFPGAQDSLGAPDAPSATDSPRATDSLGASDSVGATDSPAATDSVAATDSSAATDPVGATDSPAAADSVDAADSPGATDSVDATNTPGATDSVGARNSLGAWGALAACFAAAGLTPTGALLAGLTALILVRGRQIPGTLILLALASAPWLTATALSGAGAEPSDPVGIAAFAARAEPGLGTLGSLAGLGGIWNADAVPGSRTTLLALFGTAILLALVATGLRALANPRVGDAPSDSTRAGLRRAASARVATNHRTSASPQTGDTASAADPTRPASSGPTATDHPAGISPRMNGASAVANSGRAVSEPDNSARPDDESSFIADPARIRTRRALLVLAVAAVVVPALAATGLGREVMEWLVVQVPGAGLLRDTQKYVALAVPGYALCAAAGCQVLANRFGRSSGREEFEGADSVAEVSYREGRAAEPTATDSPVDGNEVPRESAGGELSTAVPRRGVDGTAGARTPGTTLIAAAFIALLILPLLDLAWGVGGAVRPVRYPGGWEQVAARIEGPGDVAVLPGGMFRRFPYSGKAPVLDPAPRMLPNDVLQTGQLPVRGAVVAGEGRRAQQVEELLLHGSSAGQLAGLGVGWVLVERTTPGPLGRSEQALAELEPVYSDDQLALYRVPGVQVTESQAAHRFITGGAHILWAAVLFGGLLAAGRGRTRTEVSP
ncbi:hypothetical protein AB0H76_23345 [Nocardia sp. NPDC050712]|uniref:hypothetical protein n=1 Tax=Nocardia sp. NPDC050712 TaxID=3155518 RepID=UPI0033FA1150